MTTLQAIGFTVAGGIVAASLAVVAFGQAVRCRCDYIAPRCTARPRATIYNPSKDAPESQKRGNPYLGWIPWCNALSYEVLLKGVPGTGTRNQGLDGIFLKVNLDGIVLLRFQALCLKVVILINFLTLVVILPLNITARCTYEEYQGAATGCFEQSNEYNLTNYEITTLANIPDLSTNVTYIDSIFSTTRGGTLSRLYAIVFCTWIIAYVTCKRIFWEWKTLLAYRRVYYLEKDHWQDRKRELQNSLLKPLPEEDLESHLHANQREAWIPHPEQRETVVGVGLYSVLVGGLPSAPEEEVDVRDVKEAIALANKKRLDWQLEFATEYFDACVPNPPGYSSSVAAITILPSADDLANAWGKWYSAAGKLRRLRFLRQMVEDKLHYDIDEDDGDDEENNGNVSEEIDEENQRKEQDDEFQQDIEPPPLESTKSGASEAKSIFRATRHNQAYYKSVLGVDIDEGFLCYEFGPEQTAVYSREFAQGAASCCPYGCFESYIRRNATIDELREMVKVAEDEVHAANVILEDAQYRAIKEKQRTLGESGFVGKLKDDEAKEEDDEANGEIFDFWQDNHTSKVFNSDASKLRRRRRLTSGNLELSDSDNGADHVEDWELLESIFNEAAHGSDRSRRQSKLDKGVWTFPSFTGSGSEPGSAGQGHSIKENMDLFGSDILSLRREVKDTFAEHLARESTYAVVTFVSRQAAVAARQCMADSRGQNRWVTSPDIPTPPLADAVPYNICFCRGCCRPVSLSIHESQKSMRKHCKNLSLVAIYAFYTLPLQLATQLIDPKKMEKEFPAYKEWISELPWLQGFVNSFVPGLIFTLFFALCPVLFKILANFGSNATSQYVAEFNAMQYFWYFYCVTAIWGNSLASLVLSGLSFGQEAIDVVRQIADTIPTTISATWLNWILVRTFIVLPLHFLLQMNTFLFRCLGWKCCSRIVRGGGPGGTTPYRIYIDSGLVFLCAFAFAPTSPLVAPAAFAYFLLCAPLLKRNLVFMYRPNFDSGGARWPFLADMLFMSMFIGQLVLAAMLLLKQAFGPGVCAAAAVIPTYQCRERLRKTFLRAYNDTSLFQTSELDGQNLDEDTLPEFREEFRRFLVDAHKAAYVPVCLARGKSQGGVNKSYVFTGEPAVVITHENDTPSGPDASRGRLGSNDIRGSEIRVRANSAISVYGSQRHGEDSLRSTASLFQQSQGQFGVSFRRHRPSNVQVLDDGSVAHVATRTDTPTSLNNYGNEAIRQSPSSDGRTNSLLPLY